MSQTDTAGGHKLVLRRNRINEKSSQTFQQTLIYVYNINEGKICKTSPSSQKRALLKIVQVPILTKAGNKQEKVSKPRLEVGVDGSHPNILQVNPLRQGISKRD